jgi:hypothetical protein
VGNIPRDCCQSIADIVLTILVALLQVEKAADLNDQVAKWFPIRKRLKLTAAALSIEPAVSLAFNYDPSEVRSIWIVHIEPSRILGFELVSRCLCPAINCRGEERVSSVPKLVPSGTW